MHCEQCGKDDFTHISQLNRHKPMCPSKPADKAQEGAEQPSAPHHLTLTDTQVQALQERLGEDYAVTLIKRVDALVKEMTGEDKPEPVISLDMVPRDILAGLPRRRPLPFLMEGWVDEDNNLHVDVATVEYKRRGR